MGSSPEITDDDDSFEQKRRSTRIRKKKQATRQQKTVTTPPKDGTITLSSDSDKTVSYDEECMTSDDDELPNVEINKKRNKVIKKLFPGAKKPQKNPTNNFSAGPSSSNFKKWQPYSSISSPQKPLTSVAAPLKPQEIPGHEKSIGGVKVNFPVPPYGAQIALMSKVISGINKSQNCLLESPTGSGKTLALLCAALAWQKQERDRIATIQAQQYVNQHPELNEVKDAQVTIASPPSTSTVNFNKMFTYPTFGERSVYDAPGVQNGSGGSSPSCAGKRQEPDCTRIESPQDGLVSIHKKRRVGSLGESSATPPDVTPEKQVAAQNVTPEKQAISPQQPDTPQNVQQLYALITSLQLRTSMLVSCSVPVIYYGARTHKQIQQVVKEFSRTAYCGEARMSILSSRDYSCIRQFDRSMYTSKNDMCRECVKKVKLDRLDPSMRPQSTNCLYYENRQNLCHQSLPPAFDLEDLVDAGHEMKACPYYAARQMAIGAQIVFCPYNYLIDPGIRNNMKIEIRDEIVILDEAHNIEDICREAATFTITRDQVEGALKELEHLTTYANSNQDIMADAWFLLQALRNWDDWFHNQKTLVMTKPLNNNEAVFTWKVEHFANTLNNHNIGVKQFADYRSAAEVFCRKLQDDPADLYGVTSSTGTLLESIGTVLSYLFRDECKQMDDFKPALVRTVQLIQDNSPDPRGWRTTQAERNVEKESLSLRLMCMNPAVVFNALRPARCIILSSGTLTPLISLHSELGCKFPLQVSPNHVIPADRVWIGTLTTCPNGKPLECKSQSTNQVEIQDALGDAIMWTCQVTPNGVLCFVPSYSLMYKLQNRWRETGLWRKLGDIKHVFMESRNVKDHSEVMDDYYEQVVTDKGALLIAVYRGKVSEGMDFKDNQARAVITVGIPYPNTFDMMVKEKLQYNDRHTRDKELLSGSEWLRVQAYRALNQAVGRCVRHRGDWGAVLLVDYRFQQPYYTEHLSKWVRNFLGNNHHTYESLVNSTNSLESFMQAMVIREKEEDV